MAWMHYCFYQAGGLKIGVTSRRLATVAETRRHPDMWREG